MNDLQLFERVSAVLATAITESRAIDSGPADGSGERYVALFKTYTDRILSALSSSEQPPQELIAALYAGDASFPEHEMDEPYENAGYCRCELCQRIIPLILHHWPALTDSSEPREPFGWNERLGKWPAPEDGA